MVRLIQLELGLSERRACRAIGQPRSTQQYARRRPPEYRDVVARLHELCCDQPRYGYRRLAVIMQSEGWQISTRRVAAICRDEGIHASLRNRAPKTLTNSSMRSATPSAVFCCDVLYDESLGGEPLAWIAVLDECTRECVALTVQHRVQSTEVIAAWASILEGEHPSGIRRTVRCDNSPLWGTKQVSEWVSRHGVEVRRTRRGAPWQNSIVESFFARLRSELLNHSEMADLAEARAEAALWQRLYNNVRPHSALGYQPPSRFRDKLLAEYATREGSQSD